MRLRSRGLTGAWLGLAVAASALPALAQTAGRPALVVPPLSPAETVAAFAPVAPSRDVTVRAARGPAAPAEPDLPVATIAPASAPAVPAPAAAPAVSGAPALAAATPSPEAAPAVPAPAPVESAAPPPDEALRLALTDRLAAPANRADPLAAGIADFYALRSGRPLFVSPGALTPTGRAVADRLAGADEDGLDARRYAVAGLDAHVTPAAAAEAEIGLARAVALYARDAASGRVDPRSIGRDIVADSHAPSVAQALGSLVVAADPVAALDAWNPTHPGYLALKRKLAELRAAADAVAADRPQRVPGGPVLKIGMSDRRVALLRSRLGLTMTDGDPAADVYDEALADAVRAFQLDRRLKATGTLGPQTLAALNGGLDDAAPVNLENEIVANMERWRWLPRDLGSAHVLVNVPEYRLTVTMDGQSVHESRVVVGKPTTPTPIFSDTMQFVVMNPSWNVPQSIIRKEYLPRLAEDPGYLARHGFVVTYRGNQMSVRQPPGEANALGHIKFMFPNNFSVYLHDTSSRNLFAADKRAFSHGCVRVDQPYRLAEIVMGAENGWTEERVRKLVGGREQRIDLKRTVEVHIAYFTATVGADDAVERLEDIYGYDRRVLAALGLSG